MVDIKQLERALINADAAGDADAARALAGEIRKMRAGSNDAEVKQSSASDSSLVALGAGLGKGFGQVALNAQRYLGKGINAIGDRISPPERTITSLVTGKREDGNVVGNWLVDDAERGLKKIEGELAPYKEKSPIAATTGEIGGNVIATLPVGGVLASGVRAVAPSAVGLSNALATSGFRAGATPGALNMLTRATGGGATGGASAALVDPEYAATGAAVGGALPGAASVVSKGFQAAGRAMRGDPVAAEVAALASRAKELGINIPADRIVDSKPMNALAASLNYVPMSGRAATENAMSAQLNKALSRTFGQDSSNVTMALRKADDALGGQFDDFLRSNTLRVDKAFVDDLTEAANQASKELGSDGASIISKQVDEILAKASSGEIDGQAAYNIKKTLDRIGKRNSSEAWYAIDLKQKLMDALNRSVGPEKANAFSELRKQYGSMLTLEKLAKNGVEGEVSVARLANMKNIRNPEIQELADIAAQFVKSREGQHGAMQRAVVGMGAGGLAGLPVLAGGVAAGRGTNMLLNSDLARNAVMGKGAPAVENALNRLLPGAYRAAPVVSDR